MLRKFGIIAVLSLLAVAFAAVPALAAQTTTINPANAPTGTHFQVGSATCTVTGITVNCSSYELAGVGNANATANLDASYTATVRCRNHGGQIVDVKSQPVTVGSSSGALEPKNGRLTVPSLSSAPVPTNTQFEALATCPNGNWTKETLAGSQTLSSFTYTLTFAGFTSPYITITGP
jgi:hypothetical protein